LCGGCCCDLGQQIANPNPLASSYWFVIRVKKRRSGKELMATAATSTTSSTTKGKQQLWGLLYIRINLHSAAITTRVDYHPTTI